MLGLCRSIGCVNEVHSKTEDFCEDCLSHPSHTHNPTIETGEMGVVQPILHRPTSMAEKYPKYYKPVGRLTEIDVYAVHHLFAIQDPSGAIQHASKKLLLSGARTGGKSKREDIKEARDALTRWLELTEDTQ